MPLIEHYRQQCSEGKIKSDDRQLYALQALQKVYDDLVRHQRKAKSMFYRLHKLKHIRGAYLWGGVGIGKTFLMDSFYQQLPFQEKLRLHFHAFMQYIHHELKHLQGKKNPMDIIARNLAKQYRVICFDEFVVSDIVDAMILKNLLESLFSHGVCLVATSNTEPDQLYKHGLQRSSFLPAIALLKSHNAIVHLDTKQDYRLLELRKSGVFFTPDNAASHAAMEKVFALLAHHEDINIEPLILHERHVKIMKSTHNIAWFHFHDICSVPRSQQDYLRIAELYDAVFISGVPVFPGSARNTVTLFVKLIDVLYDARIPLVYSTEAPVHEIFRNVRHIAECARTESRLQEMQTEKYFSQHLFNA